MYLGVDVGGTKTDAVICDAHGQIRARRIYGTGNWESIGLIAAAQLYATIVAEMTAAAEISVADITASAWGVAGLDWPSDDGRLRSIIAPLLLDIPLFLDNDAYLPLRAGSRHAYGIGVIAGTGSTVAGIAPSGRRFRNFGLGRRWGGFDGATQLGEDALQRISAAHFGRGPATVLTAALCAWAGFTSFAALVEACTRDEHELSLASFAPIVVRCAAQGDMVAIEILDEAARVLADNTLAIIQALEMHDLEVDVVLAGGVATGATPRFYQLFTQLVTQEAPQARPVILQHPPVLGAVYLAYDVAGMVPPAGLAQSLQAVPSVDRTGL
jgi:N-acetylglucosamine kinase-like BadF-type ATPase